MKKGDVVYLACDVLDCGCLCATKGTAVDVISTVDKEKDPEFRWDYEVHEIGTHNYFFVTASELTEVTP